MVSKFNWQSHFDDNFEVGEKKYFSQSSHTLLHRRKALRDLKSER